MNNSWGEPKSIASNIIVLLQTIEIKFCYYL
jgi:hypothetical protein